MKEDDVTHHLVFAINGFLDRQAKKEPVDKEKVNTSDEFELKGVSSNPSGKVILGPDFCFSS